MSTNSTLRSCHDGADGKSCKTGSCCVVEDVCHPSSPTKTSSDEEKDNTIQFALKEAWSGLLGSVVSTNFTYPLEFVKTRMQLPGHKYNTILGTCKTVIQEEGVLSFYRGYNSEVVKQSVQNFLYFFAYASFKSIAKKQLRTETIGLFENLLVGMASGAFTQLFVNPLSVVQTRIQTSKKIAGQNDSIIATFVRIVRQEGLGALYTGIIPTLILTSNPAIQFLVFDRLRAWWAKRLEQSDKPRKPSALEIFIIGAIGKIVATIVTYPYIMAKVRLQYRPNPNDANQIVYRGTLDVLWKTLQHDGIFGIYAGLQPALIKSVLGSALMFMAKEKVVEFAEYVCKLLAVNA